MAHGRRVPRCPWATTEPAIAYHDEEWGVPLHDDRKLFEFLILEGAQAGLSWITILKKRENYRKAFDGFRAEKIARYGARDVKRLLGDAGIVRNRLEDRGHDHEREGVSRAARRDGEFRRLPLEFCRRQTEAESLAAHVGRARAHGGIRRDEPRSAAARIQVRRLDDLLRADASDGHGQRSPRDLSATRGTRRHASAVSPRDEGRYFFAFFVAFALASARRSVFLRRAARFLTLSLPWLFPIRPPPSPFRACQSQPDTTLCGDA